MENKKKIIIDTDIGDDIDDAFALLLALFSEKVEILGVTTVFRNAEHRGKIVKALFNSAGCDVPVYVGADKPQSGDVFVFPFETTDEDGKPDIPHYFKEMEGVCLEAMPADEFILQMAETYPNEVSLVALAPFTNVANAIKKDPARFAKIKEILLMGGDGRCNFAEWNVRCDYESAKTVFESDCKTYVCGFDITSASRLSESDIATLRTLQSEPFKLLVKMMDKYICDYKGARIPTMHDPLALCMFLCQDKFRTERKKLVVSMDEGRKGMLCVCENGKEKELVVEADVESIVRYIIDSFVAYDKKIMAKA